MWERLGLSLLHRLDAERAHALALKTLQSGILPLKGPVTSPRLRTDIAGITLPNPVGLAAGFDKNAQAVRPLSQAGFGFLEVGAATPIAQPGQAKPRLFRLSEDRAAINRFGFNNDGMDKIAARLSRAKPYVPVGINLGANKDSTDRPGDFVRVLARCGPFVDFATINVSSPNTDGLRDLQAGGALSELLSRVMAARAELAKPIPIFLKIAPDLSEAKIEEMANVAVKAGVAGIIATNTTRARDNLTSRHRREHGGLSGRPLFERSTRILARLYRVTGGQMPLIGVGGVETADHAWEKICAGASAVQLYTGLIYGGITLAARIAVGLDQKMAALGAQSVNDIRGTGAAAWD